MEAGLRRGFLLAARFHHFLFFGAERKFVLQETLGCENRLKNCAALEFGRELQ
jgi:hypothetical protein